ncbi:Predicted membrane protein [Agreia bicolorata]|uniref:Predicted membrane protein n=2 Tax=Agreia bicolorata TaxID=110935 RepID=A0A1T4XX30_9MICO|nr:Predicted membrane protein [Agreia bicolorata]
MLFVVFPLAMFLSLASWALASPVGASPDDDFHLASTWCGLGVRDGLCETGAQPNERLVPQLVRDGAECYKFAPAVSAACQEPILGSEASKLVPTVRLNSTGLYPPVYYAVMGLFASEDVERSVIVMRMVSIAIFVALWTALYALLPRRRRGTLVWSWVVGIVPLGMFLLASNNPSSWAIISGGSVWIALVGYFETTGRRRVALGLLALLAAGLGAGARADSALYAIIGAGVAVALTVKRAKGYWRLTILPILIVVGSIALYLTSNQVAAASTGMGTDTTIATTDTGFLLTSNLLDIPLLWAGVFGSWALGWFDTRMPGSVSVVSLAAFAVVVFAALAHTTWRKLLVLGLIAGALVAIPVYILVQSSTVVGSGVQPRYVLPLIIMFAGVALFHLRDREPQLGRVQVYLVEGSIIVANAIALHVNMRRYLTGVDMGGWNLNNQREWWWALPVPPLAVWVIGVLTFAFAVHLLLRYHSVLGSTQRQQFDDGYSSPRLRSTAV